MRCSLIRAGQVVIAATLIALSIAGCTCLFPTSTCTAATGVTIRLINDSATQHVVPNLGICPNGMAYTPHYFVNPTPTLAPGAEVVYTSCEIADSDGNCVNFATDFMIGMCGWQYGADANALTSTARRLGGAIGVQFNCGDTIILRWTEAGDNGGTWTSEVQPATGNPAPMEQFQEIT
ncbi:MAG: hypothetical protein ABIG44_17535 [Planctomycetota bacterium]